MDPTQESTQPYADPRRIGSHNSGLVDQDVADIICILHPNSPPAHEAVSATAKFGMQHILQRDDLEYDTGEADDARDIALRFSSSVHDPSVQFLFGRNPQRCDVLLTPDPHNRHISNMHFRIFLNADGILMLQDMSTNGTVVDNVRLWKRLNETTHMLVNGSVIQVASDNRKNREVRFVVRIPPRDGFHTEYQNNLIEYLRRIPSPKNGQASAQPGRPPFGVGGPYGMHWGGGSLYNVTGQIGKGAFATVYKLATKQHGVVYAAKELDKRRFMKNGVLDQKVDNEMKIMRGLRHPNIVQYVDYHEHDRWVYIIMEYVPGGELSTYLQTKGKIQEDMVKTIARQILHALAYLHRRKITHRDIKPDNILIASLDPLRVKLSDFGLSKVVQDETFLKTFCGTLLYCAPEVYPDYDSYRKAPRKRRRLGDPSPRTSPYDHSVDMWSLGAVLYHLLCGTPPYQGRVENHGAQMLRTIMTTDPDFNLLRKEGVSEEGIDFIARLLRRDPQLRPRERECLQHPWLVDVEDIDEYPDEEESEPEKQLDIINEESDKEDFPDASQLSIHDNDDDDRDRGPDAVLSDPAGSNGVESKRPRLVTDEVRYPELPKLENLPMAAFQPPTGKAPGRLFGEITPSAPDQPGNGLADGDPNLSELENVSFSSYHSSSGESMGDADPLAAVHSVPMPRFGAPSTTSPSLQGESYPSNDTPLETASPVGTPVTPRNRRGRVSTSANEDVPDSDRENADAAEITPRAVRQQRRWMDGRPMPDTASESSNPNHPEDKPTDQDLAELATTVDERTGRAVSEFPATSYDTEHEDQATERILARLQSPPTFVKPRPILGKLVTVPGSIFDLTIRLEDRMTSWGRGLQATVVYPDPMDTRIPAYALELTYWAPGLEARMAEGVDWKTLPGLRVLLSTKTRKRIWVNGVELRRAPEGFSSYGKLYTGDIITVYQSGDGSQYLKFRCEFYLGDSARTRPADEKFTVEHGLLPPRSASRESSTSRTALDDVYA